MRRPVVPSLTVDEDAVAMVGFPLGDRQHKARRRFLRAARLSRQWRFMATKKPKGLGMGLEALSAPRVVDVAAPAEADGEPQQPRARPARSPAATSRARAWTRARSTSWPRASRRRAVMQPVLVRRCATGPRRCAPASRSSPASAATARRSLAGLDEVPVLVRDVRDEAAAAMALIENIQREDLNPLEEARGLRRLTDEFGTDPRGRRRSAVGRSRSATTNLLRLLNLTRAGPADAAGRRPRHGPCARVAARSTVRAQIIEANEIVVQKLSVRDAERRRRSARESLVRGAARGARKVRKGAISTASNNNCRTRCRRPSRCA